MDEKELLYEAIHQKYVGQDVCIDKETDELCYYEAVTGEIYAREPISKIEGQLKDELPDLKAAVLEKNAEVLKDDEFRRQFSTRAIFLAFDAALKGDTSQLDAMRAVAYGG